MAQFLSHTKTFSPSSFTPLLLTVQLHVALLLVLEEEEDSESSVFLAPAAAVCTQCGGD